MKPDFELHIDELLLEGFTHSEGAIIGKSIEQELARLVGEMNSFRPLSSLGDQRKMVANPIHVNRVSRPEQIGKQIARSLHGQLSQADKKTRH